MSNSAHASDMASRPAQRRTDDDPIGAPASNATTFEVRPRELGVGNADAPERVAVDLRLPIEIDIRTPKRRWHFEFDEPGDDEVAYVGISRTEIRDESEPQCVPGWMPAVMAYVGFEIADSGVKR